MEKVTPQDLLKMGLGAMFIAKEKVEKLIDESMKQGDITKEQGEEFLSKLKKEISEKSDEADKKIKEEIHHQLKEMGLATKEDLAALRREITALKKAIEEKK